MRDPVDIDTGIIVVAKRFANDTDIVHRHIRIRLKTSVIDKPTVDIGWRIVQSRSRSDGGQRAIFVIAVFRRHIKIKDDIRMLARVCSLPTRHVLSIHIIFPRMLELSGLGLICRSRRRQRRNSIRLGQHHTNHIMAFKRRCHSRGSWNSRNISAGVRPGPLADTGSHLCVVSVGCAAVLLCRCVVVRV